jgi:hypothetical protein
MTRATRASRRRDTCRCGSSSATASWSRAIRTGQLDAPTTQESEGKTAAYWAGYLAHYLEDNTQPQHATIDYRASATSADKRGAPNVHGEVEYKMNRRCRERLHDAPRGVFGRCS